MNTLKRFALCTILASVSFNALAEIAIVVHKDYVDLDISRNNLAALYLGKTGQMGNVSLKPVDQVEGSEVRSEFYKKVTTKKTEAQLMAHWAGLIFSGRGQRPQVCYDDEEVLDAVAEDRNMIGYVNAESINAEGVSDSVVVVMVIN